MLYNVFGKHVTSPKKFIRLEADNREDAIAKAEEKGWTVAWVDPAVPSPATKRPPTSRPAHDPPAPEYEGLWMMALLIRLLGVAMAVATGYALLNDNLPDLGVPNYVVTIILLLIAFEVYVLGEAVGAFRHLVQNSWAWRRAQK